MWLALQDRNGNGFVGMQKGFSNLLSIADGVPGTGLGTFGLAVWLPVGRTAVQKRKLISLQLLRWGP